MKKKILIISYSTLPSNSPRAHRTHELATELSRQGHEVILSILTGQHDYKEYSKFNNIQIKPLGKTYFFKFDPITGTSLNITSKVVSKITGKYLEFPFIELMRNTYLTLDKEVLTDVDLLITVAVPHPIHWGTALFRKLNYNKLKDTIWVADCGDPYMGNPNTKRPFYFKFMEKMFGKHADYISIPTEEAKQGYYPEFHNKIKVIPQGFNFNKLKPNDKFIKNDIPTFIYAGTFYSNLRDPRPFLDYLKEINKDFKFIVYTKNSSLIDNYIDALDSKLEVRPYIPREDLILEMSKADFLVNFSNSSSVQTPSKLIDYTLSGKPIMNINTNISLDTHLIQEFLEGNYSRQFKVENIEDYNIRNVADKFLKLL